MYIYTVRVEVELGAPDYNEIILQNVEYTKVTLHEYLHVPRIPISLLILNFLEPLRKFFCVKNRLKNKFFPLSPLSFNVNNHALD